MDRACNFIHLGLSESDNVKKLMQYCALAKVDQSTGDTFSPSHGDKAALLL